MLHRVSQKQKIVTAYFAVILLPHENIPTHSHHTNRMLEYNRVAISSTCTYISKVLWLCCLKRALCRIDFCVKPRNRRTYCQLEEAFDIDCLQVRRKSSLHAQMYRHSKHEISLATKQCEQISRSDPKTILRSLWGVHCLQIYI